MAKKHLAILLSMIVIFVSTGILAAGAISADVSVYSPPTDIVAGDNIKIPVYIKNNSGILGFKLIVNYDSDVLTPVSVDLGKVLSGGLQDNITGDSVPGEFNVYWAGSDEFTSDGIMFYINFSTSADAVGKSEIQLSYSQEDTFDVDFNDVKLACSPIELSIENAQYPGWGKFSLAATDTLGNTIGSNPIAAGNDILISVNSELSVNKSEFSAKYRITYDESAFTFNGFLDKSKKDVAVDGYAAIQGKLLYPSNSGAEYLCFKINETALSKTYDFVLDILDCNVAHVSSSGISVPVARAVSALPAEIYSAENLTAENNEVFTVPVYISNNSGIMGYRLEFQYDSDKLEVQSVANAAAFTGTMSDSIGNEPGTFSVLWNTTEDNYVNGVLFTVNFKAITNISCDTLVSLTYSQPDTFNEQYKDVTLNCNNINIALNNRSGATVKGLVESPGKNEADTTEVQLIPQGETVAEYKMLLSGTAQSNYKFSNVGNGTYILRVIKNGYVAHEETITVTNINDDKNMLPIQLYMFGDVNGSGLVDNNDVTAILNASVGIEEFTGDKYTAADLDRDGAVDGFDGFQLDKLLYLKQI